MDIFSFIILYLSGNEEMLLGIFIPICGLYYIIFKKYCDFIIDPFSVLVFHLAIYTSVVIYIYTIGIIDVRFFIHFTVTTFMLVCGFKLFNPINAEKIFSIKLYNELEERKIIHISYIISSVLYVFFAIYIMLKVGFPALSPEIPRTTIYQPVAVYKRIAESLMLVSMCILPDKIACSKLRVYDKGLFSFVIINLFLSGGKSAFYLPIACFIVYSFFAKTSYEKILKYQWKISCYIFSAFIFIIWILLGENENFYEKFLFVLAGRADAYIAFYTSDYNEIISYFSNYDGIYNFISHAFFNWLPVFKLVSYEDMPLSYADLMNIHTFGGVTDEMGMVATYNLFPFAYTGWFGSIFFSFFVGAVYSFIRNRLIYYCAGSLFLRFFYIITYISFSTFVISMPVFWDQYFLNVLVLLVIIFISIPITRALYKRDS